MPYELGRPYPFNYQGFPTHMSTEDYSLWLAYQPTLATEKPTLYFDVRIGAQAQANMPAPPKDVYGWWAVNAKRLDVLEVYTDRAEIVELRENAQPNAIGRLLTYEMLWKREPPLPGAVRLHLVTNREDPDVRDLAKLHSIAYTVIPTFGVTLGR